MVIQTGFCCELGGTNVALELLRVNRCCFNGFWMLFLSVTKQTGSAFEILVTKLTKAGRFCSGICSSLDDFRMMFESVIIERLGIVETTGTLGTPDLIFFIFIVRHFDDVSRLEFEIRLARFRLTAGLTPPLTTTQFKTDAVSKGSVFIISK